jgi:hypothetical protein
MSVMGSTGDQDHIERFALELAPARTLEHPKLASGIGRTHG